MKATVCSNKRARLRQSIQTNKLRERERELFTRINFQLHEMFIKCLPIILHAPMNIEPINCHMLTALLHNFENDGLNKFEQ